MQAYAHSCMLHCLHKQGPIATALATDDLRALPARDKNTFATKLGRAPSRWTVLQYMYALLTVAAPTSFWVRVAQFHLVACCCQCCLSLIQLGLEVNCCLVLSDVGGKGAAHHLQHTALLRGQVLTLGVKRQWQQW